jgi:hypothetical protein
MRWLVARGPGCDLRCRCGLSSFNDGVEGLRVGNGNLAQHFSVQRNVGFLAGVDELTVPYVSLSAGCVQSGNPQASEIAFPEFAANSSVDGRPYAGLFRQPVQPAGRTAMALYCIEDSFLGLVSCGTFSYSWHISFPLKIFVSSRLLAAAEWGSSQAEKQALSIFDCRGLFAESVLSRLGRRAGHDS